MQLRRIFPSILLILMLSPGLDAVVISEIHYNTPGGNELLEFVELTNETTTPEDLSGWEFVEGISYKFPRATILPARGIIVVVANEDAFRVVHNIENVFGNYQGLLAAGGERLTLVNHVGVVVRSIAYDDDGKWPVGPDGTGHTLSLASVYLDPGEPESWIRSTQIGGTPGLPTFPEFDMFDRVPRVPTGAVWRYREGTEPFPSNWREVDFDDSTWSEGSTPIGTGYGDEGTPLADLPGNYTTVAIRIEFQVGDGDINGPWDLFLAMEFDDGFCAWLNGQEVARQGCPDNADGNSTATESHESTEETLFQLPAHLLGAQDSENQSNVISILGLNDTHEGDRFRLNPRVIRLARPPGQVTPSPGLVFNELFRGASAGDGWVEIYNAGPWIIDLGGYDVTDDIDRLASEAGSPFTFPAETSIAPGEFIVVREAGTAIDFRPDKVRLFLVGPDGALVTANAFRRSVPADAPAGLYSEASYPDGASRLEMPGQGWLSLTPTPGAPNEIAREEDLVINEIFYHPPDDPAGQPRSEFVELYNRGTEAIDLSGFSFNRGITFAFETASIGAGDYVVIAANPVLLGEHHDFGGNTAPVFGPYEGVLADGGENIRLVDRLSNLVDEVRYHDGGAWSRWADGRGASLELIDPFQDNDVGAAWGASDESDKAPWEEHSYQVENHFPFKDGSEFHLFLVEKGICRIDDVSVTRSGGENLIPNAGFEAETTLPWIIEGTHRDSRRITTDSHSGDACLEIEATSKGNSRVNRLEIDTDPALTAGPYDVSFWARWQRGTSLIITHSDFTDPLRPGVPAGNTLGARLRMTVPLDLGTPGAENSIRKALRNETGGDNLGPVIDAVRHSPAVPFDSEPVGVTARVSDSDGVANVRVVFRADLPGREFQSRPLFDDGRHGDGAASDGLYRGEIPGFAVKTPVVFYVEASDAPGNTRRSPRHAPDDTHVLLVNSKTTVGFDTSRILLDSTRTAELDFRPLHSNDLLHGTYVFNESETFYNVGVRYRGSPWGRPERRNYRVSFPSDKPFLRDLKDLNITRNGLRDGTDEGSAYFVIGRLGTREHRAPVPHYLFVSGFLNDNVIGTQAAFESVNGNFISRWYGDDVAGPVLKGDGRQNLDDAGDLADAFGASLTYRGEHSESYRLFWPHSTRQTHDDWQPFIDLCRITDPTQTSDAEFDAAYESLIDVEAFFRVHGARTLMGDSDALFVSAGHNGYLVRNSITGLWNLLPFDMDGRFNVERNIFRSTHAGIARMFQNASIRRIYYRVLVDYVDGYWSVEKAGPWLEALQASIRVSTGDIVESLTASNAFVREEIEKAERPFRVVPAAEVVLDVGEQWSFRKGTAPFSDPPSAWREAAFDDADWTTGPTPFAYGDITTGTQLNDMRGNYTTVALRKRFNVTQESIEEGDHFLAIAYDDGFCAYLNGQEIGRENCGLPGEDVAWDATADDATELATHEAFVPIPRERLLIGDNVIAILTLNVTRNGPDFGIIPRLLVSPDAVRNNGTARLVGDAPFRVATLGFRTNDGPSTPLIPKWTSETAWSTDFEIDPTATEIEIVGFDNDGILVDSASVDIASSSSESSFRRGEVNDDDRVNLTDAIRIVQFLFRGESLNCLDAADVDDDGQLAVNDVLRLLLYLFAEEQEPPAPFAIPGADPTDDALDC